MKKNMIGKKKRIIGIGIKSKVLEKVNYRQLDQAIAERMCKWGIPAIRISFAIIFFWFGILKPFGLSPATELLKATVAWLPLGKPDTWLIVIGWWEVVIGITFLFKQTTRIAIALLFLQMFGTFMPFVFLPKVTFHQGNYLMPTFVGQYIIKNIMIISAALVVGGTCRREKKEEQ